VREAPPSGGTPRNGRGPGAGPGDGCRITGPASGLLAVGSRAGAWLQFGASGLRSFRQVWTSVAPFFIDFCYQTWVYYCCL
uniref:Uncharacterized protein n=1 Tax=Suricata suricatta TaxID=37032 RepID=A0A673VF63_SURSU